MSAPSAPAGADSAPPPTPASVAPSRELCPMCASPLAGEQEWCLTCGAAARTRLGAAPRWKGLVAAVAIVVVLSLGVLAAALVKLAGDTGPAPTTTRTVTTAAAVAPAPTTTGAARSGGLGGGAYGKVATPGTVGTTRPGARLGGARVAVPGHQ